MAIIERIVTVYNDKGSKQAVKDLNKLEQNFKDAGKKIAKAFAVAAVAAGALAVKLGKDGVEAAIADQKSQALLANALRNTTGANEAAIASVEDYISAQQRAVAVTDDELRPSLATLLNATKDVTEAQSLQNLALDISADGTRDLQSVSLALAKAVGGNFGALTKLGVPLSDDIKKSKDLNAALAELSKTFAGAAATRAGTFEGRMTALRISFDETLETLGYALIPVLEELATVFQTQVLPVFEEFIANNKDQIADTLRDVAQFAVNAGKGLGKMFKTISDNMITFKIFASILTGLFVGTAVYNGVKALIGIIGLLTTAFGRQAAAGTAAGAATAFATGGTSAFAAAAGILAFTAAVGGTLLAINSLTEGLDTNTEALEKNSGVVLGHLKDLDRLAKATQNANLKNINAGKILTNLTKKTAEQIASEKALAALKKQFKVVPTNEKDPIQLEAARLNLVKQANIEELRKVEALIKNAEAQMKVNENAQRYADLLQVLSDQTISSEEVSVLASKWGITEGQVLEYIARVYAANTTDLNDGPIVNLLMKWGLTKQEAEKYVDFTRALKDEKIDDKEIEELMGKWGMTRQGVLDYAKTVQDGTALQAALAKSYSLPGDETAAAWQRALEALRKYIEELKKIPPFTPPGKPTPPGPPGKPRPPGPQPEEPPPPRRDGTEFGIRSNPFNPDSADLSASKIAQDIATLTSLRLATSTGTGINFLLKEQIDTLTDALSLNALNAFGDERARLRAMGAFDTPGIGPGSSFNPGSFRMGENAGMVINLNVAGNVTSENDLVDTFRQKLLLEQQSGKPILFVGGL